MIDADRGIVLRQVGTLFRAGTFAGMSDGQLLEHFLARGGEAGELAFAVLVERHGPMVLRVCRGVLGDRHDAEDAFQATFLALVRGAGSIRRRESVAFWLHGAALRVSACARSAGARRRRHEGQSASRRPDSARDREPDDLQAVVHEELARLPARYRAAVALCDLEGLSLDEVARHLGCPVGTVKSRVARGRERLRGRLVRRGVAPAMAAAGFTLARGASAAVRPALADATSRAAAQLAAGRGVVGLLAASVEILVRNEARRALMHRIGAVTAALATAGVLVAGANGLGRQEAPAAAPGDPGPMAGMMAAMRGRQVPLAPAGSTFVKVYTVADILGGVGRGDADMTSLVELITSSVTPGVWKVMDSHGGLVDNQDGGRSIQPFARDLTLIIRQTAGGHEQVAERLEQIRQVLSIREARSARVERTAPVGVPVAAAPPAAAPSRGLAAAMGMMGGSGPGGDSQPNAAKPQGQAGMGPSMMNQPQAAKPQGQAGAMSSMMNQPQAAKPPGQADMMSNMMNPTMDQYRMTGPARKGTDARAKGQSRAQGPAEAETERRLRALEEKLDRVLKVLDVPRPDKPAGDALPR